jgi:L-amino acid N-acyltransferase YncA
MRFMTIRPATEADAPAIADIYNQGIRTRQATFDTNERTAQDIRTWLEDKMHPLLVAEQGGAVLGWIHASSYRSRACYSGVAEFSVYVSEKARGQGVGDVLMTSFITACESVQALQASQL